ncbi:putative Cell division control protein [Septoria linicola]|nr:putative Cell division control protein [Septoria linicola]
MATNGELPEDPLSLLRRTIADQRPPIPTTDPDQPQTDVSLAQATHLLFNFESAQDGAQHLSIALNAPTRFISAAAGNKPLDLRSIYFCWLSKDKNTADYLTAVGELNNELKTAGKDETASNVVFAEKLDLNMWLAGEMGENDSEYIKSIGDNKQDRAETADMLKQAQGDADVEMLDAGSDDAKRRDEEERLNAIYSAERKMGDHNTILRGVKIQDFSSIRKYTAMFLNKSGTKPGQPTPQTAPTLTNNPALRPPVKPTASGRRPEPIILLSSSFSSLLKMQNIKSFLSDGTYQPLSSSGEAPNILHIPRSLRTVLPGHSTRFILVDDPSNFRPDYWNRVVAVFTTGQTWQFKSYKWTNPAELFSHALGVYVGWSGEVVPDTVKGWGRQVLSVQIDKGNNRWRDREVVETIWSNIEGRMRAMGWGKDGR